MKEWKGNWYQRTRRGLAIPLLFGALLGRAVFAEEEARESVRLAFYKFKAACHSHREEILSRAKGGEPQLQRLFDILEAVESLESKSEACQTSAR